jgi:hypothetical protein
MSRRLGDRGDLVACLTSQIGTAVEHGREVSRADVDELESAVKEIESLLEDVEAAGRVDAGADDDGRASAD